MLTSLIKNLFKRNKLPFNKIALVARRRTIGYNLFSDDGRKPTAMFPVEIEKYLTTPLPIPRVPTVIVDDGEVRSTYYPPGQLPRGWSIEDHDDENPSWLLERVS